MKTVAGLFLVLAWFSLAADKTRQLQEDDIREAVFRWQFANNASYDQNQKNAQVYFLEVNGRDPPDTLIKRFTDHKPPVRKVSSCSPEGIKGVRDKKTGQRGLIFRVTTVKWLSETEVTLDGGYHENGLSASGNTYTLKKENEKWKVTKDKMHWMS
jgi:hypothetical protein